MLPGLRFLFVAIVLSVSMLIFGLGAAALLRSAQEEFANLPIRRVQPETVFTPQTEAARPTLAMLRVNTPVAEPNGIDRQAVPDVPNAAPPQGQPSPIASIEPDRVAAEPDAKAAEPDKLAAPTPALPSEEKFGSSDMSSEAPAQAETTARVETPVPPPESQKLESPKFETQAAAVPEPTPPAAIEKTAPVETTAAAASEPTGAPTDDSAKAAAAKIATLGGPAVTIEPQPAPKHHAATAGKNVQARRLIKRRRIVRARIVPPRPAAQPTDPGLFGAARPGG